MICNPFFGIRAAAANLDASRGNYTAAQFAADMPQFFGTEGTSLVPETLLGSMIDAANASISPDRWGEYWRQAVGLYVAHRASIYLKTALPAGSSAAAVVAAAAPAPAVKSVTLGDTSVSYSDQVVTDAAAEWGSWATTTYGLQLIDLAKLVGMGGMYVI